MGKDEIRISVESLLDYLQRESGLCLHGLQARALGVLIEESGDLGMEFAAKGAKGVRVAIWDEARGWRRADDRRLFRRVAV